MTSQAEERAQDYAERCHRLEAERDKLRAQIERLQRLVGQLVEENAQLKEQAQ